MLVVLTDDESDTVALGVRLGAHLAGGMAVALVGDLGAGKTALARGIARGLGVAGRVRSPTYILAARYESGRHALVHADLYRLGNAHELAGLDLASQLAEGAVALVEWADRFPEVLPADHLWVEIRIGEGESREISLVAAGPVHAALLESLDA